MEYFKLKQPDQSKYLSQAIDKFFANDIDLSHYIRKASEPEYLFWDKVRYQPRPKGLTKEEFWALIKYGRQSSSSRIKTVVKDKDGNHFSWQLLPNLTSFFREVDMDLGGALQSSYVVDESARHKFITRGIMEEAIASSQLEGASTTRKVAKQMLIEDRKPRNRSEQMILNNYRAMLTIENELQNETLNIAKLLKLHSMLMRDTINNEDLGRFRKDEDNVIVCDPSVNLIYHIPPNERILNSEIKRLINYANDKTKEQQFIHPVIKAIILHFWIGYLHPFTDGNGRLARIIFYWYLLRSNYWAFTFLPLSRVIRNSPAQYRDAFVYSEQDGNDLTYFIDYNMRKILQAKREFENYVKRIETENKKMARVARSKYRLNDRQIQALRYLHKNNTATLTIKTHARINLVTRMTARQDLEQLEKLNFLKSKKIGRERPFSATSKTSELF